MIAFVRRYLDPSERMSELLFGVIMTLTFTLGAGLVVEEGPDATREMLIGVIGCNVAWGVIDGLLFVFGAMYARGFPYRASRVLAKEGRDAAAARIDDHLEGEYGSVIPTAVRTAMRDHVIEHVRATVPPGVRMTREDLLSALAIFVMVAITSVPAVLPFLVFTNHMLALRVSNLLLVGLMFAVGWKWAGYVNVSRWKVALGMAVGGLILVQVTIFLGG